MLQNPSVCRGGTPCTPSSFDEAVYCAVFHSAVPAKAVADALGVKYGYLAGAVDPQRADAHVQARWLVPLMQATGNLAPLRYLAAALHCAVVELPAAAPAGEAIYERLADVVRELGEDSALIQRALVDGRVTDDEAAQVDREIAATIDALLALREAVRLRSRSLARPAAPSSAPNVLDAASPTPTAKPAPMRMSLPSAPARAARPRRQA